MRTSTTAAARAVLAAFLLAAAPAAGCQAPKSEVIVLGMIHGGHRASDGYGIDEVTAIVRRVGPDLLLCEIPPERLGPALAQHRDTGVIAEERVRVFPEYVDAIIPLSAEMDFRLVGCARWTTEMARDRRAKLAEWRTTRAEETAEVEAAQAEANRRIEEGGGFDDPYWVHTDEYDAIVKEGLEPYNRLFNDDLGAGGWDTINAAHYALIAASLDMHRGEGRRFLVTFGAWHKYWFLEKLRERDDIVLLDPRQFLGGE